MINSGDAIKYAKWLIAEKPTNETRSPFDQRTIDKALKEVSKQYINLPKSWKKNFESVGKLGGAVAIGAIIGGYGKDYVQQWWANRNTGSPAKKPEKGAGNGGAAAGGPGKANFPGNLFAGDNKVVPNPKTVTDDFPWIWVIIGALVAVVIGLALYLNQDSLFGSGGYGEDEGYDDGTTKKTKKGKRRGSKQRKRRHSI
ncbi:hypothetical protein TYRP_007363 [Tyrophagus putrescentiae]|nr:hypothetical protein TYRP_007363 [Tyrophagus putrescentiae]